MMFCGHFFNVVVKLNQYFKKGDKYARKLY